MAYIGRISDQGQGWVVLSFSINVSADSFRICKNCKQLRSCLFWLFLLHFGSCLTCATPFCVYLSAVLDKLGVLKSDKMQPWLGHAFGNIWVQHEQQWSRMVHSFWDMSEGPVARNHRGIGLRNVDTIIIVVVGLTLLSKLKHRSQEYEADKDRFGKSIPRAQF